jgi:hypothetical protein
VVRVVLAAATLLCACSFDEGGVHGDGDGDGDGDLADAADPAAIDARADANRPDAAVPCTDRDDDGHLAIGIEGSDCGLMLDCDDDDPRAFPGQGEYFDTPRAGVGGYDFNCNGDEETLDSTLGGECREEWWSCNGTGWVAGVPGCGGQGSWHVCASTDDGCAETSSTNTRMACR